MSLFSDAMGEAFEAISEMAEEDITYTYDGIVLSIVGVPGQDRAEITPTGGRTQVTNRTVEWMIHKSLLPAEPKRGIVIEREDGRKYMVSAVGGGACWRWSDANETYYRIQSTKLKT